GIRSTQFAPYTFDASVGEIFGALLAGAEMHLLADALIQDPQAVAQYLTDQDIQTASFPPPYLQQMDPAMVPEGITIMTAGSAPTRDLIRRWSKRGRYINGYGPTEATVLSSAWMSERDGFEKGQPLSIGRPIGNTSIYIVDSVGQLCAPGLMGEIWLGGDGVAGGYLNRPELTAEHFMSDPWKAGGRLYRTGDLGRWLADGRIEFAGRRDRQVKLRGFRVELNEIESRIRQHPTVEDAVVLVRGENDDQQLLAWIVPKQMSTWQSAERVAFIRSLRAFIKQSLPHYMLPQALIPIDRLPLTANGKLDANALPQPDAGQWSEQKVVAPSTAMQSRLVRIWAEVLNLKPEAISVRANFFELGGQSLLAMRMISRLREELAVDIHVTEIFERPVLADLAAAVEGAMASTLPPIVPVGRDGSLPLSFTQQRLWFIAQIDQASVAYNMPGGAILQGDLHVEALHGALNELVARHEVLRTGFDSIDGEPVLTIRPHADFALKTIDLISSPENLRRARLQENIDEE
ncbi:MAG TPA: AMP-binding protein, partial [Woeseiaceae bacterium]